MNNVQAVTRATQGAKENLGLLKQHVASSKDELPELHLSLTAACFTWAESQSVSKHNYHTKFVETRCI